MLVFFKEEPPCGIPRIKFAVSRYGHVNAGYTSKTNRPHKIAQNIYYLSPHQITQWFVIYNLVSSQAGYLYFI